MKNLTLCLAALLILTSCGTRVREIPVRLGEVAAKLEKARPGDRIVIENGTYRDMELRWSGQGTEDQPIVISAATPGGVVIEGVSSLRFSGEWLVIEGLCFRDGNPGKLSSVIDFRNGDHVANHCRVTNCVIDGFNPDSRDAQYSHVRMFGRHNRFDHNTLQGKLNLGVTLIVMLDEERSRQNHHRIDHNYFGWRPVYGSNGAETIRAGTSQQAYESSNTVIEDNVFEHCNGEVEVVSIKSSDNVIRRNVFLECEGVLALRHGDRNVAEENIFLGKGRRNTGGIRVVNAAHRVRNNYFEGLRGERFFAPLALMNAVPNSLPNRYCLVEDVEVTGNVFVDCSPIEFGTGRDAERTLPPERILFAENTIVNPAASTPFRAVDDIAGFTFRDNRVRLAGNVPVAGFVDTASPSLPEIPAEAVLREGKGAGWFANEPAAAPVARTANVYEVKPGDDIPALAEAAGAGDTIRLVVSAGDYTVDRAITVRVPLTIEAAPGLAERPVIRFTGPRGDHIVTIADGGKPVVRGIAFSGIIADGRSGPRTGISTAETMIQPYTLVVENCRFSDFGEGNAFAVKGTKNTFAESVVIRDCLFEGLSGDAINYAAEREDAGKYNADDMLIENCAFYRILGLGVNIYRGGSDESTAGPYVTVRRCNFEDVCNKERGSVMRLIGPQVLSVTGCNFSNSGRGGASIRLDETSWEKVSVTDCNFWNAGRVLSMTGKAVGAGIRHIEPRYVDAAGMDFRIAAPNPLAAFGIGLESR